MGGASGVGAALLAAGAGGAASGAEDGAPAVDVAGPEDAAAVAGASAEGASA